MAYDIAGRRVAFLATDGVEQVELTGPWEAVQAAGGVPVLVSPATGTIQAFNHNDKGDEFSVDVAVAEASADDFDALVLPGGVINGDAMRTDADGVAFAKSFFEKHKPVGAICHASWTLIEAGVVHGREMTSWPSLATDLRNAGATWKDEEVVVDSGFVTSRGPDDLAAFNDKVVEEIAEGEHRDQSA